MKRLKSWLANVVRSLLESEGYTVLRTSELVELDADLLGIREHMYDISDELRTRLADVECDVETAVSSLEDLYDINHISMEEEVYADVDCC